MSEWTPIVSSGQVAAACDMRIRELAGECRAPVHMPRYYFNIFNDDVTLDPEGFELADDAAAMAKAVLEVRSLAAETVGHGHFFGHHRIEVVDADRKPVGAVRFDEAVTIQP